MVPKIPEEIKKQIEEYLARDKLSQRQIAKLFSVSRMTVFRIHCKVRRELKSHSQHICLSGDSISPVVSNSQPTASNAIPDGKDREKERDSSKTNKKQICNIGEDNIKTKPYMNPSPENTNHICINDKTDKSEKSMLLFEKTLSNGNEVESSSRKILKDRNLTQEEDSKGSNMIENPKNKNSKKVKKKSKLVKANPKKPKRVKRTIKKYRKLDALTFEGLNRAKSILKVDTKILKKISLLIAEKLGLESFKASNNWVSNFKKRFGIRLRNFGKELKMSVPTIKNDALKVDEIVQKVIMSVFDDADVVKSDGNLEIKKEELKNNKFQLIKEEKKDSLSGRKEKKFKRKRVDSLEKEVHKFEKELEKYCPGLVPSFVALREEIFFVIGKEIKN